MRFINRLWRVAVMVCVAAAGLPTPAHAQTRYFTEFELTPHPSRPYAITAGPDGALWFTEVGCTLCSPVVPSKIGRITTSGQITSFHPVVASPVLTSIVSGPDGALWFVDQDDGQIGRITTAGTSMLYSLGSSNPGPETITSGPDGALWFTENGCATCSPAVPGEIGRITTGGVVTQYQITSRALSSPFGIVSGSDGALWFTEAGCRLCSPVVPSKIGRITTAGVITEFDLPANRWAGTIAAGPDGALWFLEVNASTATTQNEMGRITTAGALTEFPLNLTPTYVSVFNQYGALTPDAGGNALVYVGNGTAGVAIGYMSTAGAERDFVMPNYAAGYGVVTGPDGAQWFTGYAIDAIGRFGAPAGALAAAVLPSSRSVTLTETATAFATIINGGTTPATNCGITPNFALNGFSYQTTDSSTNATTGTPNSPIGIAAGKAQSFVISFGAQGGSVGFGPASLPFEFFCDSGAATIVPGVNTLLLSQSTTPTPDLVALGATTTGDGILHISGTNGSAAFAVATVNLGSSGTITVTANTGSAAIPVTLTICQTNPVTAQCLMPPAPSVTATINQNDTPTFSIFAAATGTIAFAPGDNRIFVQFTDAGAAVRGSTSVAVETQ